MIKKILGVLAMAVFFSCPVLADTYTSGDMVLTKPAKSSLNWDGKINGNFDILASSVGLKASSQTWSGQNSFLGKVGIFGSTAAAYGLAVSTTASISGKLTSTVASDILDWTSSGFTSTFFGSHNGAISGDDGFGIYDKTNTWNGRLDLGLIYGPQLHGKGAIGAPLLGLNTSTPKYAFDVTGGGHYTSSMTVDGNYYGVFAGTIAAPVATISSATIGGTSLPTVSGTASYILTADGAGKATWAPVPSVSASGLVYYVDGTSPDITGYKALVAVSNYTPSTRSTTTIASPISVNTYISSAVTNSGHPGVALLPAGTWSYHFHAKATNLNRIKVTAEVYIRTAGGVEYDLAASQQSEYIDVVEQEYSLYGVMPSTSIATSSRVVAKLKATTISGAVGLEIYHDGLSGNETLSRLELPAIPVEISALVPYVGADKDVVLGLQDLSATSITGSSITATGEIGAATFKGNGAALTSLTAANISAGTAGINITGNSGTATALAADPTDCTLPQVALGINASGTAVCSQPSNITGNAATVTNGLYTTTSFSGDVTGNYNTTVVGNDSHNHTGATISSFRASTDTLAGDVSGTYTATVVADDSHLHSASTLQNVVSTGTAFGGDVSGTYNAIAVADDSHSHSASTLTGVIQSTATGTYAISITGNATTATTTTGNAATATKLLNARTINGVSFDGTANINIATTSYLADGVSLDLTGATFSAKSSSVTLQGNTFNGANQLVKLDALSKLPAVDGSQLLNLPSTSGGAVLASTQTFTGQNEFASDTTLSGGVVGNTTFETATATTTFSGWVDIGRITYTQASANGGARAGCGAGLAGVSGGCKGSTSPLVMTYPSTESTSATAVGTEVTNGGTTFNSWTCGAQNASNITAYVICARIK